MTCPPVVVTQCKMVDTSELLRVLITDMGDAHSGQVSEQRDLASDQSDQVIVYRLEVILFLTFAKITVNSLTTVLANPEH